jgi:hypothetical protein
MVAQIPNIKFKFRNWGLEDRNGEQMEEPLGRGHPSRTGPAVAGVSRQDLADVVTCRIVFLAANIGALKSV